MILKFARQGTKSRTVGGIELGKKSSYHIKSAQLIK